MATALAAPAVTQTVPRGRARLAGALLGSVICAALLAALYAAAALEPIESLFLVRYVLGPDGFMPDGTGPHVAAWACGPVAAAIAGALLAVPAVWGERWAGVWMGVITFFLTLLLASLVPDVTHVIQGEEALTAGVMGILAGAPLMTLLAAGILAPLCVLCVGAGAAWAWILRRALTGSGSATRSTLLPTTGRGLLIGIGVALAAAWLLLAPMVGMLFSPEAVFD